MIETLFFYFIEAWAIALIAFLIGRYVGKSSPPFARGIGSNFLIYFKVWVLTTLSKLIFSYLGYEMHLSEAVQSGYAEFAIPVAIGAYFSRELLTQYAHKLAIKNEKLL